MAEAPRPLPMIRPSAAAADLTVGIAAGIAAALAMNLFQSAWISIAAPMSKAPSATEKAADKISDTAVGKRPTKKGRKVGGSLVHYITGAIFGGIYGVAAGAIPLLASGHGTFFAGATWFLGDELAVPAMGLGPSATKTPPKVHAFGLASHLVFGITLDFVRRQLNALISARRVDLS